MEMEAKPHQPAWQRWGAARCFGAAPCKASKSARRCTGDFSATVACWHPGWGCASQPRWGALPPEGVSGTAPAGKGVRQRGRTGLPTVKFFCGSVWFFRSFCAVLVQFLKPDQNYEELPGKTTIKPHKNPGETRWKLRWKLDQNPGQKPAWFSKPSF